MAFHNRYIIAALALLLAFMAGQVGAYAQGGKPGVIAGLVTDAETGQPLPGATIRLEGTKLGAICGATGGFLLKAPRAQYTLAISYVGYRTERIQANGAGDSVWVAVALTPAVVISNSIVVTAEDPGVGMMRQAIARKVRQQDSLRAYSYTLYTKFVAATDTLTAGRTDTPQDTAIGAIFESYSDGYFSAPDEYYNEILQRRQSVNVPPQANFVAFGTNLNAYDDYVTIIGEEIATPFHPGALDFYTFVLEGTLKSDTGSALAVIRATPKGDGRKLFDGYVYLDPVTYAPVSVKLVPNRAVQLPFDATLSYIQQFGEYDTYTLPTGLQIESSLLAELFWIISPRLDIRIETVAYNYQTNIQLPDGIFSRRRVEAAPSADEFDSAYWAAHPVLPLRAEELAAYDAIRMAQENPDSVQGTGYLDKAIGDITRFLAQFSRKPFTGYVDIFRYNRVTGPYVGIGLTGEPDTALTLKVLGGYGVADNRWYGRLEANYFVDTNQRVSLQGRGYRELARTDNPYLVKTSAITPLAFLSGSDYGDYYYNDGVELGLEAGFGQLQFIRRELFVRPTTLRLFVRNEEHRNATVHTQYALLGGDNPFRLNPPILDGNLRSAGIALNLNYSPERRLGDAGLHLEAEFADPDILGGDFRFQQYRGALNLRTRTLPLWQLDIRLSGAYTTGNPPPQRFASLESSVAGIAGEGTFRKMEVKEFYGDRFAALSLEHNFGEVIPGVLRIPNIASFGIEFIALANVGWSDFSSGARFADTSGVPYIPPTTEATPDRFYYEVGLGLNRLLLFFRFDVTARLSQVARPQFSLTVSTATF